MFHDSEGNIITPRDGRPLDVTVALAPGQSTFLDLNGDLLPERQLAAGSRTLIDPCIGITCGTGNRLALGNIVSTVELFDNETGKTSFAMQPQPPPNLNDGEK